MAFIKKVIDEIEQSLDAMVQRGKKMEGYLNRVVYGQYQAAKAREWETEGQSEGATWKSINKDYERRKKIRFADAPGAGAHLLIATGRLVSSVIGPSSEWTVFDVKGAAKDHRKKVERKSITISTVVPYAEYVNQEREFVGLGDDSQALIFKGLAKYMITGEMPEVG